MKRWISLVVILILLIATLLVAGVIIQFMNRPVVTQNAIRLDIKRGYTGHHLARQLAQKGQLQSQLLFRLLLRWRGDAKQIQAGEYKIKPGTTPSALINKLIKGDVVLHAITLVDGHNSYQILHQLQHNPYVDFDFKQPVSPRSVAHQMDLDYPSIEGWLAPNTYLFPKGAKASAILLKAYRKMQKHLQSAWQQRQQGLPYHNPYQALIVASMIEKETALAQEMPIIAGIILKRWQHQRLLQIDASVIYGLLPSDYQGNLTKQMLRKDTPYNTYIHKGLPPTPISMPSQQALQAALHPQKTDYWYYVAKGDGSHQFSKSLSGQRQAIQHYQLST